MLALLQIAARLAETLVAVPVHAFRLIFSALLFNPRLGRLRFVTAPAILYVLFAFILVYVYAPLRGMSGQVWMGDVLAYANQRSLGTAIYDKHDRFVGIFDPILDSERDFNHTGKPIALPDYIAYPDHKSLHVGEVPDAYWRCLVLQEDRHLGGILNPFGIDLFGVLKIPWSTLKRSFDSGRPRLGAGGSTLSMQLARTFFKTPPNRSESALQKLARKTTEWWLAPVIHWQLTKESDITPLKRWSANHFPHAQRTGGQALYGVEQTSLIVFGKSADALGPAEQFVLAAAVNQPIILLEGSERLNATRQRNWRRIVSKRARYCASKLIPAKNAQARVMAELDRLAEKAPTPKAPATFTDALASLRPASTGPAHANPIRRSNTLIPAAKYGVRDELKNTHGFAWREHAGSVKLTLDVAKNLTFRRGVHAALRSMQARHKNRIDPRYSLDVAAARNGSNESKRIPDIIIAAADRDGRLIRYYESNFTAAYFGSARARDAKTGRYHPAREDRFIASLAKIAAATAIANDGGERDEANYLDTAAPKIGLEACKRGRERRLRKAEVTFACSLNRPLEWRLDQIDPSRLNAVIRDFGLNPGDRTTPPERALVIGHLAASPRTVHRMAGTVLSALTGDERAPRPPSLLQFETRSLSGAPSAPLERLIKPDGRPLLARLLAAPICYRHGTLSHLGDWCAARRSDLSLHFAKTGTRGTGARAHDAYDTVDLWVAGGMQFKSGGAFSYVVLIGTGNPSRPWARDLYAGAVSGPLLRLLYKDLAEEAALQTPPVRAPESPPAPFQGLPERQAHQHQTQALLAVTHQSTAQRGRP